MKKWREQNRERHRELCRSWSKRNYDSTAKARDYLLRKEEIKESQAAYRLTTQNLILHCAREAARRAQKGKATPPWADIAAIKAVYAQAKELEKLDGVKRHVDHIVPLKGRNVCGLHVLCNLRIITASDNLRKSARFEGLV